MSNSTVDRSMIQIITLTIETLKMQQYKFIQICKQNRNCNNTNETGTQQNGSSELTPAIIT